MTTARPRPEKTGIQSISRAFELLDIMARAGQDLSISELAEESGLPLPTIHRIVRTLLELGHVHQLGNRRYSLGPRLIGLGERASHVVGTGARVDLTYLAERIGESANMAVLAGTRAIYTAQVPSRHSMRMSTDPGRRVHLHSTGVGKALLAQLPDQDVRRVLCDAGMPSLTIRTITDQERMVAELDSVRRRGHAIDDGEQEDGVFCVAVPVPGAPAPTALSVSGPVSRFSHDHVGGATRILRETADKVARRFG